jgi:hypothetical protein
VKKCVGGKRLAEKRLGVKIRRFAQAMARFVYKILGLDFRKWLEINERFLG